MNVEPGYLVRAGRIFMIRRLGEVRCVYRCGKHTCIKNTVGFFVGVDAQ